MDIIGKTNFHNVTAQANDYLASYGYYGDLDFNGKVEMNDIALFYSAFVDSSGTTVAEYNAAYGTNYAALGSILGDLNYDGLVDDVDENMMMYGFYSENPYGYLNNAYPVFVPEPSMFVLILMGAFGLLVFRRIKR